MSPSSDRAALTLRVAIGDSVATKATLASLRMAQPGDKTLPRPAKGIAERSHAVDPTVRTIDIAMDRYALGDDSAFDVLYAMAAPRVRGFLLRISCVQLELAVPASGADASSTSNPQTPPTNGHDVETWLQAGSYKSWHCEAAPHPARSPSPHGMNRICSNDLTSSFSGTGERPQGTAAVKELYDDAAMNVVGYAVYLKTQATSAQGGNWYFYERVPTSSAAPHDAQGVVAEGRARTRKAGRWNSEGRAEAMGLGSVTATRRARTETPRREAGRT
jgi:hypothetical protein